MFYIIIRGAAGVGKSSIAKKLEKELEANYISFDKVMSEHNLDIIEGDGISTENFIKANNMILEEANKNLKMGNIVIFDGCFYREGHLKHLLLNLPYKYFVFTLKAPLDVCFERNESRFGTMPEEAVKKVYALVSQKDFGQVVDTNDKSEEKIVKEIKDIINGRTNYRTSKADKSKISPRNIFGHR